jgi:hypothetical protein
VSWSRYAVLRKRLAPLAFLGAIALLAHETCEKRDHRSATFVIELGAAEPRVRALDARLFVAPVPASVTDADAIGVLHRRALVGARIGHAEFKASMPAADGELRLDVDLDGELRQLVRRVHAEQDAVVTIDVAAELGATPRPASAP